MKRKVTYELVSNSPSKDNNAIMTSSRILEIFYTYNRENICNVNEAYIPYDIILAKRNK